MGLGVLHDMGYSTYASMLTKTNISLMLRTVRFVPPTLVSLTEQACSDREP